MPNDIDILTPDEAVAAVNLNAGRVSPDSLDMWVTAVSQRIDALCGPVVVREVADEVHDGYCGDIILRSQPVYAVTTVTEYTATTPTTLVAENFPTAVTDYDYYLDPSGILRRRSSGYDSVFAGRVTVTYDAGRYATTAAVDARFKLAAASALRRLWAREAGAWSRADPFSDDGISPGFFTVIDPVVKEWLGDERLAPVIA